MPQFSVTLAACLLFILGAFKSAAITPPVTIYLDLVAFDEDNGGPADIKQNSTLLKGWQLKSNIKSFVPF